MHSQIHQIPYNSRFQGFILGIIFILLILPSIGLARSVPVVQSVTTYFAELPRIILPCGDLKLTYYPEYDKYKDLFDLKSIKALISKHDKLLEEGMDKKIALQKSLENFLMAGYAYYRAMGTAGLDERKAELRLLYAHFSWYWQLDKVTRHDAEIQETAKKYFDLTTPLFSALKKENKAALIESLSERLACIHKHRQSAFEKISKPKRYTIAELSTALKDENISIETASTAASDLARYSGFSREYSWMVSEAAFITSILRTLLQRYEQSLSSNELHPGLLDAHEKYGAALGPEDKFLKDTDVRKVRIEIARIRARAALNYLYLSQAQAEETFNAQLNFSSGIGAGLSNISKTTAKSARDLVRNKDLINFEDFEQDIEISTLAIIITAADFASSTFSLVTTSLVDTIIGLTPADLGIRKTSEKAFDAYKTRKNEVNLSIKVMEKLVETLNPDDPVSFNKGHSLSNFIVTRNPSGSDIARQAPNTVNGLLEDPGFIDATGGGLGWILEPLCESPGQRTALLMNAARYSLTGNARTAFHRIAFDRGLWIDNPDLPLTKATLKGNTLADYANPKGDVLWQATIRYSGNLVYFIPLVGQAKLAYDKLPEVRSVFKYEGKNEVSQDQFLKNLIDQQERFDLLLSALSRNSHNYSLMAKKEPQSFKTHLALLADSPDYLAAYINIQNACWDRVKMFNSARFTAPGSGDMTSQGKAILVSIDKANELEATDLSAKLAYLKTQYHALSINYLATAQQLGLLQELENYRRSAFGINERVDLSKSVAEFKREARLSELTITTQNLFQEMMIDLVTANMMNSISNLIISKLPARWGVKAIPLQQKILNQELFQAVNPWVGKFTKQGVWEVVENAAIETIATSAAQMTEKQLGLGEEFEASLTKFFNYATTVTKDVSGAVRSATLESHQFKTDLAERLNRVAEYEPIIKTRIQKDNELTQKLFEAIEQKDTNKINEYRKEALERAKQAALSKDKLRYYQLMDRIKDLSNEDLDLRVAIKNNSQALETGETAKAFFRKVLSAASDDGKIETAGRLLDTAAFKQQMTAECPSVEDLKRLTDRDDPAGLHQHLLTDGFDIQLIRKGLIAARDRAIERKKNSANGETEAKYTADLEEIKKIALQVDDQRIEFINTTLTEFFQIYPEFERQVQVVMQGGAAKGNPEYQGIFGDIDFTILTRPGADGVAIKEKMDAYFRDKGRPLATEKTEGYSPMDTEAFIQPMGNFKSAKESLTSIVKDVMIKMGDPTRFYSEAGGKWFINNMLYSGKKLWPSSAAALGDWVRINQGEAYGLAVDMTRYLSFLTDPHYSSEHISTITDPAKKKKTLETALSKTKYFIRLIDAYIISHDKGNELYHKRISQKKDSGDDASYHWQIFKDAQILIKDSHENVFNQPGDLEMIQAMAKMKMKGNIISVWDVLGDGPDGIKKAEAMIVRMEQLAPEILASTAETHKVETLNIAKNGTEEERRSAFAGQLREASVHRKISEVNEFGSKSMMLPKIRKIKKDGKQQWVVLSQKEHGERIAERMAAYRKMRGLMQAYEEKIKSITRFQALKDPEGRAIREQISTILKENFGTDLMASQISEKDLVNLEDDSELNMLQYNWAMAGRLSHGLDENPGNGVE